MLKLTPFLLLVTVAACNDGLTPPPVDPIAIEIEPGTAYLVPGDTFKLRAVARRPNGGVMNDLGFEWISSSPDGLMMLDDGRAVAIQNTDATVTARTGGAVANSTVHVCAANIGLPRTRFVPFIRAGWFQGARFDGSSVLFEGGAVYGTSSADLIVGSEIVGVLENRIAPSGLCSIDLLTGDYTRTVINAITRSNHEAPKVRAEQETFSAFGDQRGRLTLLRYTFTNITAAPVTGLRFALNLDWDLERNNESPSDDRSEFLHEIGAEVVTDPSGTTVGVAGLDAPIVTYRSYLPAEAIEPSNTTKLYESMVTGISQGVRGPTDVRDMVAFAPMSLAVGESRSITLVMIAAESRAHFESSIQVARELMSSFPRKLQALD